MIYAGFWRRLAAFAIDALLLMPPYWLHVQAWRVSPLMALVSVVAIDLLSEAYTIGCHARWGQTIGKMAVGIRVAQLDGAPITARHALLRNSVEIALILIGLPSMAHVLLTWSAPEWTGMAYLEQHELVVDRDPLSDYAFTLVTVWQASEFLVMLFNERRRALHDFIAGTVVVRRLRDG